MLGRTRACRPAVKARRFSDRQIVDAGVALAHQSVLVERPILVAVRAIPLAGIVVPFVREAHGDAVFGTGPELLDQAIIELFRPFALEECDDRVAAGEEFSAIAPSTIDAVRKRYTLGVAAVPSVLGHPHLQDRGFAREWRKRRAALEAGWADHLNS